MFEDIRSLQVQKDKIIATDKFSVKLEISINKFQIKRFKTVSGIAQLLAGLLLLIVSLKTCFAA